MAKIVKELYRAQFTIPATAAGSSYSVPVNQNEIRRFLPLNGWELQNLDAINWGVRKNQNSDDEQIVPAGNVGVEDIDSGIGFTSISLINKSGVAASGGAAVLIIRKLVEE
jgi:hypothetical protein